MMAVRERAVKVMAALERRVPSLGDFEGQSWSTWAERAGVTASDGADVEECGKNGKKAAEAMSLSKEDMSIFGHCPGQDDFYLVVCSHCGQVVKPQAFEKHCERRHGPLAKVYARLRSPGPTAAPQPQQRPRHGHSHSPSHAPSAPPASAWEGRGVAGQGPPASSRVAPPSPATPPQYRHSKSSKEGARPPPLEKSSHSSSGRVESPAFKPPPPLDPPLSSPPLSLRDPPWPHGGATPPPGRQSPGERGPPSTQKKDSGAAPGGAAHRVPRPYNKVASRRECDLDKHCGVLDPDRKKVCTRLLTCNIHSIHQRRKVPGRSKTFDQLVAELKTRVREKGPQSLDGSLSSGLPSSPEAPREPTGAPHCRRPLATLPAFSRSRASSESTPEEEMSLQDDGSLGAPSPLVQGPLSSDDSDGDGAEEAPYPSSTSHPRPLAVCSFGSHALGHGVYTFDRRLHHLRSALSSMLEQHISAHLWKKIPQAQELQSPHPAARTTTSSPSSSTSSSSSSSSSLHSKFRTGSHISSSSSSSSSSRGLGRPSGQSENSSGGSSSSSSSGPRSAAPRPPRPPGLGRPKNPVGRPSKQMLKQRDAAALRKRKAPSQEGERSGPDRNCVTPQDRGRPPPSPFAPSPSSSKTTTAPSPLPHGQTNGTLSPGGKPRPQPSPSEPHSAAAAWSYKRIHPPAAGHPSPAEAPPTHAATNSHGRGLGGVPGRPGGVPGRPGGRDFEHRGPVKKRKAGNNGEHSPSAKPSAPRPASSSSSSSSPRSNFYPWKESKGGPLEKKLATQKVRLGR
ncbi:unnamed protein product [Lota lota]